MNNEAVGKAKGGEARAMALTPARRKEIAMMGVEARKNRAGLPRTICGDDDKKISIGDMEIQCYVLEGEVRVLTLRTLQSGIGMSEGGGKGVRAKYPH